MYFIKKASLLIFLALAMPLNAQRITDAGYRTVGYIKTDGTVQDASYRTIGHAGDIPMRWAALFFFFRD